VVGGAGFGLSVSPAREEPIPDQDAVSGGGVSPNSHHTQVGQEAAPEDTRSRPTRGPTGSCELRLGRYGIVTSWSTTGLWSV
jgi:hypothetical protein